VEKLASAAYWIGVLSTLIALVMRGLALVGIFAFSPSSMGRGNPISYRAFLEGAVLFYIMAIASGLLARNRELKT